MKLDPKLESQENLVKSEQKEVVEVKSLKKKYIKLDSKIIQKMIFSLLGGLGIFLLGMRFMSDGIQKVAGPSLKKCIKMVTNNRVLACIAGVFLTVLVQSSSVTTALVGCILTVIVQSSSATLGITIALATTGVIPFETAAALVLGENIGTTITAFLTSIGASTNAKRAAYFHIFFNLVGVFWITLIFSQYMDFITWFMGRFKNINATAIEMVDGKEVLSYPYMTAGIAMFHTIFNVANVVFFLPFTAVAANILNKIVKDKKVMGDKYLINLDFQMYDSPFAAIEQSAHEIKKMEHKSDLMLVDLKNFIEGNGDHKKLSRNIFRVEDILDKVQTEVTDFLTDVMSQALNTDESEEAKKQLLLADEYESISDYIMTIIKHFKRLEDNNLEFNDMQKKEILELHEMISAFYKKIQNPDKNDQAIHSEASVRSEEITAEIRKFSSNHWERLSDKRMDPLLSTTFTDVINSYRKIKTLILHVAETRAGIK
ncbi:Na/Pi symporter [Lentisphaera marina]|uniref:Na/Pi cotransporter family protein n=1 Tax=Lentisphaera marina TaxID=1111041 RepID=UPI002365D933|nr:Na/Pi symporter [Lentisphaera marina]MDD7984924.1 Na/Pi symporter [Lentisphaera marina]